MLKLKEANFEDIEKEWEYLRDLPADENGFMNPYSRVSFETFKSETLREIIDIANGVNLPENFVPQTYCFLWDGTEIVGLFKIRPQLNDSLRNGAGHIGFGIKKEFRGRGYGKKGLALAIEILKNIIPEDEIYMSVDIDNPASLGVMLANGAYIHHSDEREHYTRIPIK